MKYQLSTALLGLAATVFAADDDNQTGPFSLRVKGTAKDSKIDGYLTACHAGAAIEAICYTEGTPEADSAQFYFNTTSSDTADSTVGSLTFNLPYNDDQILSQPLSLSYSPNSNVAVPFFGFDAAVSVGFDDEKAIFIQSYQDDSVNTPETAPNPSGQSADLYQWAVCWQYPVGSYYYQSLGWIQAGSPHNPTCEEVEVTQE
ncbi:hypothetical protein GGS20DRAFT_445253 [Poronia punctata]|nr:hypothetical protein GGS20DRAFT_445253 [Poronia punctata]